MARSKEDVRYDAIDRIASFVASQLRAGKPLEDVRQQAISMKTVRYEDRNGRAATLTLASDDFERGFIDGCIKADRQGK
ncbi:MAG: hypothetical protein ACYC7E_07580 [Armatimonadota bacterium]